MEVYFNELSLENIIGKSTFEKSLFEQLLGILNKLNKICGKIIVNYHISTDVLLGNLPLIKYIYFINKFSKENRSILAGYFARYPINKSYPEYKYQNRECFGLGLAYSNDSISISIASEKKWQNSQIEINCIAIDDITNSIEDSLVRVSNISNLENIEYLDKEIQVKIQDINASNLLKVHNGRDIVNSLSIFPHIVLSQQVKDYIVKYFKTETAEFRDFRKKTMQLNNCFANDNVNVKQLCETVSGEPRSEFETRRRLIDDTIRVEFDKSNEMNFYWHINTYNADGRIHFYPDYTNKKCYIGYIGNKIL